MSTKKSTKHDHDNNDDDNLSLGRKVLSYALKQVLSQALKRAERKISKAAKQVWTTTPTKENAMLLLNGDITGAAIGMVANAYIDIDRRGSLCDALEREEKAMRDELEHTKSPYRVLRFGKLIGLFSHEKMHKIAVVALLPVVEILNTLEDGKKPTGEQHKLMQELARSAVTRELKLADQFAANFAMIASVLKEADFSRCDEASRRMMDLLENEPRAKKFLEEADFKSRMTNYTPQELLMNLTGMCLIEINQGGFLVKEPYYGALDHVDALLYDLAMANHLNLEDDE